MAEATPVEARAQPSWLMPAALLLVVAAAAGISWLDPWIATASAAQKAAFEAARAAGGVAGYASAIFHAGLWVGVVILLRPMLLLGLVVLAETVLAPPCTQKKNRLLAWTVRAGFLVISYLLSMALARSGNFFPGPLFDAAGPGEATILRMAQMALLFVLTVFVTDFFQYWAHRAYHRFAFLWKFHAVHHAPRELDALHNFVHPVEGAFSWLLVAAPVNVLIAGVDANQLDLLVAFYLVQNHIVHMRARIHFGALGKLLVDNRYHFIHHSRDRRHFDTNFAALTPLYDRLFGTYCAPEGDTLPATGLDSHLPPSKLSHFLLASLPPDTAGVEAQEAPAPEKQPLRSAGAGAA